MLICLGAVELAAAGVSIALFNQASKITIFPLVSITTSFVAEEDTIKRMQNEAENDKITKLRTEVMPKDNVLEDIEKGTPKENIKAPNGSMVEHNETNGTVARSCGHEDDKKHVDKTNGV
ncbi:MATE efflux family protein FRD3-like, partial [Trifolium medium]|nr:MATE efflux family protein FRD3-like [Trifolium medium]